MTARRIDPARIARTTGVVAVLMALASWIGGVGDGPSVLFGGGVAVVNFHLIRVLVSRLMTPLAAPGRMSSVVAAKLLVLLAVLAVSLRRLPIDAASFLVGTSTLFLAVLVEAAWLGEPLPPEGGEGNEEGGSGR